MKIKVTIRILLTLLFLTCLRFQVFPQNWPKTYPNWDAWAQWIIETYDKGYIILGNTCNCNYGLVIKTDINGNILWYKEIGDNEHIFVMNNIEQTLDMGYIISGTTTKFNQYDAYIIKLNHCGEIEWCNIIYTPNLEYDIGLRVKQTPDLGYLLLGSYNDPNPDIRTNLFKFDSIGNLIWHKGYLPHISAFNDDAQDLIVDSTGFLITSICYYPDPGGGSVGWNRFYFTKTDTAGDKLWDVIYGDTSFYYGYPMISIKSNTGNFYSFGKHDIILDSIGYDNPAMVKILSNGTQSYSKDILSNLNTGGCGTAIFLNDTTIVNSPGWAINMYSVQNLFMKTDTFGNVLKSKVLPPISDAMMSMAKTFDNKIVSIANNFYSYLQIIAFKVNSDLEFDSVDTHPFTYDSLCPYPITSGFINPTCDQILDVSEPQTHPETTLLKVYPNPASNQLKVEFPKYIVTTTGSGKNQSNTVFYQWKSTTLEVYDFTGKQILTKEIPKDQQQMSFDISAWHRGMYYFRLSYRGQTVAGEKVVLK
ncbi:MAG: T9SS type A sorting domain-containing protein [Bacteroidota bacterium]|nr:T9SS type A sorting domain-containing protein [Bacteroidota bacterium]